MGSNLPIFRFVFVPVSRHQNLDWVLLRIKTNFVLTSENECKLQNYTAPKFWDSFWRTVLQQIHKSYLRLSQGLYTYINTNEERAENKESK